MRKLSVVIIIFICVILIGLSSYSSQRKLSQSFSTNVEQSPIPKLVVSFKLIPGNSFLNKLQNYVYVAHRGAPLLSQEPENSIAAFKVSKELGYKIIETDLQLTKDGKWIILHDFTLDRTTNGKGKVDKATLKDIQKLKLKSDKDANLCIPTLEQFLMLCSSEELIPILDIKPNEKQISSKAYTNLISNLNRYNLMDKSIFCSSSKGVLIELRNRSFLTPIAVMLPPSQDNLSFVKSLNNAFIYCNYKEITEDTINLISKNGLRYGVWTVNDDEEAKHYIDNGALMVVTDKLNKTH